MTIPTQMNCPHKGNSWCLPCVGELAAELTPSWTLGVPDPVSVITHTPLGGIWVASDPEWPERPSFLRLRVYEGTVHLQNGLCFYQDLNECRWASRSRYRPVDRDGMPVL